MARKKRKVLKVSKERTDLIKSYDNNLWTILILIILLSLVSFFVSNITFGLILTFILGLIIGVISLLFGIGMIYHMIKQKSWVWLILAIGSIFIPDIPFFVSLPMAIIILYYFVVMRKVFKLGGGEYN